MVVMDDVIGFFFTATMDIYSLNLFNFRYMYET